MVPITDRSSSRTRKNAKGKQHTKIPMETIKSRLGIICKRDRQELAKMLPKEEPQQAREENQEDHLESSQQVCGEKEMQPIQ